MMRSGKTRMNDWSIMPLVGNSFSAIILLLIGAESDLGDYYPGEMAISGIFTIPHSRILSSTWETRFTAPPANVYARMGVGTGGSLR